MDGLLAYASDNDSIISVDSSGSDEHAVHNSPDAAREASNRAHDLPAPSPVPRRAGLALPPAAALLSGDTKVLQQLRDERAAFDRHQGRVRAFPHVEGNYAIRVYIALPVPAACEETLWHVLSACRRAEHRLLPLEDPGSRAWQKGRLVQAEYHLSLSRTVAARKHHIQPLLADVRAALAATAAFTVELGELEAFVNEERTRSFLALRVVAGAAETCMAVRRVDAAFAPHGLQASHAEPRPHVSLAWVLGDRERQLGAQAAELNASGCGKGMAGQGPCWRHAVQSVQCRIGQVDHVVWST